MQCYCTRTSNSSLVFAWELSFVRIRFVPKSSWLLEGPVRSARDHIAHSHIAQTVLCNVQCTSRGQHALGTSRFPIRFVCTFSFAIVCTFSFSNRIASYRTVASSCRVSVLRVESSRIRAHGERTDAVRFAVANTRTQMSHCVLLRVAHHRSRVDQLVPAVLYSTAATAKASSVCVCLSE